MSNSNGKMIKITVDGYKLQFDENEKFEHLLSMIKPYKDYCWTYAYDGLLINGVFYEIPNKDLAGKPLKETPINDGSSLSWYCKEVDFIPQINIRSANIHQTASPSSNRMETPFKAAWNRYYKNRHDNYFFRLKNKDRRLNRIYIPHPTYIQSIKNCATQTDIPIAPIQVKPRVINNSLAGYRPRFYSASLSSRRYK